MLLTGCTGKKVDEIITYLSHTEPFSPRVLNTIFRNSPEGARMDFISTFTDMRTLKNITNRNDLHLLRKKLHECDIKWFQFVINIFMTVVDQSTWRTSYLSTLKVLALREDNILEQKYCTTEIADYIRNYSWEKEVCHVTVPHPAEQTMILLQGVDSVPVENPEHIVYVFHPPLNTTTRVGQFNTEIDSCDLRFMKGKFQPYYGSGTAP